MGAGALYVNRGVAQVRQRRGDIQASEVKALGVVPQSEAPPKLRAQRIRSSASAPRSPLTRHPLGDGAVAWRRALILCMNMKEATMSSCRLLAISILATSVTQVTAQAPPTETRGVTEKLLAAVDLGPEIDGMAGRKLRMRLITIDPGGATAIHSHKDRPGTVYILQGNITDHRDGAATEYGPGLGWAEDRATTHWIQNTGTTPAVEISVDIFKQP